MNTIAARHYLGDPSPIIGWTCPACGETQTVAFGEPCMSCGAGAKPYIVDRPSKLPPPPPGLPAEFAPIPPDTVTAFDLWWEVYITRATPAEVLTANAVRGLMRDAFEAGYRTAAGDARRTTAPPAPPTTRALPMAITFDPAGAVARTLAAALALFVDQVLSGAEEEIASGEWCSLAEAHALVQHLTKEGSRTV